jgi:hypothetical protein
MKKVGLMISVKGFDVIVVGAACGLRGGFSGAWAVVPFL